MQIFSQKNFFTMDLSDLSLKIAQLKKKGKRIVFSGFGQIKIPLGLIQDGAIKDEDKLVDLIKKSISEIKGDRITTNRVVCNLPEEEIFIRLIQLPKMKEEEINNAVYFEAENHIPLKIEEVYLDWQLLKDAKDNASQMEIIFAAVPKTLADSYLSCLKKAGLWPIALEPESAALARCLIKEEEEIKPIMIVDIGQTGSNIVIFAKGAVRFTSRVPVSGQAFEKAIAKELKISIEEAIKVKIEYGLVKEKKVYEALSPVVSDLTERVRQAIDFFCEHVASDQHLDEYVSQIILCGGDSQLIGLTEFFSEKLVLPVRLGNPWVNISPFISKKAKALGLSYRESLAYATAFGLALRDSK